MIPGFGAVQSVAARQTPDDNGFTHFTVEILANGDVREEMMTAWRDGRTVIVMEDGALSLRSVEAEE